MTESVDLNRYEAACQTLKAVIEEVRFLWEGKTLNIGASIGLVPITEASESLTSVLRAATD